MTHPRIEPMDDSFKELAQAIGRAVLGGALLEKILLVDIAGRKASRDGTSSDLAEWLEGLERRSAGQLLAVSRDLGLPEHVAGRIGQVVERRNWLVHRFMQDPAVMALQAGGADFSGIVDRVDQISQDIQDVIHEIAPTAFKSAERVSGISIINLVEQVRDIDLEAIDDPGLRRVLEQVRLLDPETLAELLGPEGSETSPGGDAA